jgi:site-specific DNA-methyltransferase (cytosine-N4-specific)
MPANDRKLDKLHATGLKTKDLIGIPWMLAFALRADGWYLRQDIIWHKPNPMPEPVQDRCTKAHEYIFLLSKSHKYYYDINAIKEPVAESTIGRKPVDFGGKKGREYNPDKNDPNYRNGNEQWGRTFDYQESCKNGRNKRSVWEVSTKPYEGAHFAVFPEELIEPCVIAGAPVGGIVLDPFMGSGTTAQVAQNLGRKYLGCELNPEYKPLQEKRLRQQSLELT